MADRPALLTLNEDEWRRHIAHRRQRVDRFVEGVIGRTVGTSDMEEHIRWLTVEWRALVAEVLAQAAQRQADTESWLKWWQFVFLGGGKPVFTVDELRAAVCAAWDDVQNELKAERAQRQEAERERDATGAHLRETILEYRDAITQRDDIAKSHDIVVAQRDALAAQVARLEADHRHSFVSILGQAGLFRCACGALWFQTDDPRLDVSVGASGAETLEPVSPVEALGPLGKAQRLVNNLRLTDAERQVFTDAFACAEALRVALDRVGKTPKG